MTDHSQMKLGKLAPKCDDRTLRLARYLTPAMAAAPAWYNAAAKITDLGMMGNDTLGDCTCATVGHMIQTWSSANGSQEILPDADIVALYENFGYNPEDPSTDQGANVLDVLNYWRQNPVNGHQLSAYASLNPKQVEEVRKSIYYFGGAYIGVQLPVTAQNQDAWTVTSTKGDGEPGSWGGHAIPVVDYDENYVYCITWGAVKAMTWDFFTTYCDEAFALLSPDWLTADKSPTGFDSAQLQSDLTVITQ